MGEFDEYDIDSWGKAPRLEKPAKPVDKPKVDQPVSKDISKDHETRISRSNKKGKHLTSYTLKEKILESKLNMGGRLTLQKVLKRNKSDDVSIPAFILELLQQLKEDGYES